MNQFIWHDGALLPAHHAMIPVTTHTLHYGSGAFEGIRCYATEKGPAIFRLSDHINRLLTSFSLFEAPIPWTAKELEQGVIDTIHANNLKNCYVRPILFFGSESLLLDPHNLSVHCAIIAFDMEKYLGSKPISVGISKIKRISPHALPIHCKINGFYVNSICALNEVKKRGFDEALLLDQKSFIAEGSVANIFFVIDGTVVTPPSTYILPGITRASIITLAKEMNIPFEEKTISVKNIQNATEAFFTGTASEITPIAQIEHVKLPHTLGPITQKIKNAYHQVTRGMHKQWITSI